MQYYIIPTQYRPSNAQFDFFESRQANMHVAAWGALLQRSRVAELRWIGKSTSLAKAPVKPTWCWPGLCPPCAI